MKISKASRAWRNVATISSSTMRNPATISLVFYSPAYCFGRRKKERPGSAARRLHASADRFLRRRDAENGSGLSRAIDGDFDARAGKTTEVRQHVAESSPEDSKLRCGYFYIP